MIALTFSATRRATARRSRSASVHKAMMVVAFSIPRLASAEAAGPVDGLAYAVSALSVEYVDPNPAFPSPDEIAGTEVELGVVDDGFVQPRRDRPLQRFKVSDVAQMGATTFYASAIRSINQQLVSEFNRRDFHAIVVSPMPDDIERRSGRDLRPAGRTALRLGVFAGRVRDLKSFSSGDRFSDAENEARQDRPEHAWIREGSPVQPGGDRDLVRKDALDTYVSRLNRHPGRRVDIELSPSSKPGGVNLDYYVAENKPWFAYAQLSNTGTEETTELRERFGLTHTQLTGHDDILRLDYITGDFDDVHAVIGSYDFPWWRGGPFRTRLFGAWSEYQASILGFNEFDFEGSQWTAGGQISANVLQCDEFFVDLLGGLRISNIYVKNPLNESQEHEVFFLPMLGLRSERNTDESMWYGEVTIEHSVDNVRGRSKNVELGQLGRSSLGDQFIDPDWYVIRWDASLTTYLSTIIESIMIRPAWQEPPLTTRSLAHEFFLSTRGQYALGDRLIPQETAVAGGLQTVRGYPESAAVGDKAFLGTFEYRFHLPRLFAPDTQPLEVPVVGANFRLRPQYAFTQPDWDLIFRAFVDVGRTMNVRRAPNATEKTQDLVGVGLGAEVRIKQYVSARFDWGHALSAINRGTNDSVRAGNDRFHFMVTLLY